MNNKDPRDVRETTETTYTRDNDVRFRKDGREVHRAANDMSWLIPALLGLLVVGALSYYFLRNRFKATPHTTTPVTHQVVTTEKTVTP
jgi:hypothetical protein